MKGKAALKTGGLVALWIVVALFLLFPFYYAVVSSFREGSAIFEASLWPANPTFANYEAVMTDQPFATNILNSLIVAVSVVALSLGLATFASYAFGRAKFKGRRLLLYTILGVSMFPQVAVLSGLFEIVRLFGLYNNLLSLVFSYMIFTLPFTVWVLTSFMRDLPVEIEEAAIMDGASSWTIVTKVFLPLLAPALVTTGLLAFIAAWNEFLFALSFTLTNEQRTVPVAIALITGASQYELPWGNIMAASVIVTVPLIVLVLFFQKKLVAGLTAGAVKG
ncbi:carbohydrate ABC transporter permease [Croceicoccus gelatinilyticus]|uniref:carbohydrate ABC transporter permease n=1 Tax=Croceicoccus gelatinilyticus TaxID=2835536 RepID=UPI001BD0877A|nr:carbohydrate ABC transporter permease [Croceicoccus gelatinilyticus]MBS7670147.1 carbohydrate ABC transporter permease [Croceicoccus gelatinilyticus]